MWDGGSTDHTTEAILNMNGRKARGAPGNHFAANRTSSDHAIRQNAFAGLALQRFSGAGFVARSDLARWCLRPRPISIRRGIANLLKPAYGRFAFRRPFIRTQQVPGLLHATFSIRWPRGNLACASGRCYSDEWGIFRAPGDQLSRPELTSGPSAARGVDGGCRFCTE